MKYHNNGVLREEPDMTLRLNRCCKLTWREYLPPVILCILISGLLLLGLLR